MCDHEPKYAKGLCRKCYNIEYHKMHRSQHLKQMDEWYQANKSIKAQYSTKLYKKNRDERLTYASAYRKSHRDQIIEYRQTHKNQITAHYQTCKTEKAAYKRMRRRSDPQVVVAERLRTRLRFTIKNKSASTKELTGCEWPFLVAYLESKFKKGMTWENRSEWHVDHIRPLASFDLTDPEQQQIACHYTNLQPLWAEENLKKGNRICS
jgi:hypothetical protein